MALRKSRLTNAHPPMKSRYTDPSELEINISTVPEQLPTSYSMTNGFGKSKSLTPFSRSELTRIVEATTEGGGGGGGFIILAWSKCLNNEFTEDKQLQDANGAHTIPGGRSNKTLAYCSWPAVWQDLWLEPRGV
ncbi:hypothetical protein B0H11DRAFT_1907517 [Mycena galericulata]|nr:hypothetical protein B0H11DRAFT_1907517 [Mycena galericulata]